MLSNLDSQYSLLCDHIDVSIIYCLFEYLKRVRLYTALLKLIKKYVKESEKKKLYVRGVFFMLYIEFGFPFCQTHSYKSKWLYIQLHFNLKFFFLVKHFNLKFCLLFNELKCLDNPARIIWKHELSPLLFKRMHFYITARYTLSQSLVHVNISLNDKE